MIKHLVLALAAIGVIICGLTLDTPHADAGIGVSRVRFEYEAIPNIEIIDTMIITRTDDLVDQEQVIEIGIYGDAAPYVFPYDGEQITIPAGVQQLPYRFAVRTQDLAFGSHEAKIGVSPISKPSSGSSGESIAKGGSGILTGAAAEVIINVTGNEVSKYKIVDATIDDAEENQTLFFSYLFANEGNVPNKPAKIQFTATDVNDATNTYSERIEGGALPEIGAYTQEEVTVETQAKLALGTYDISLEFCNEEGEVVYQETTRISILKEGSLGLLGELVSFKTNKSRYEENELIKLTAVFQNKGPSAITGNLVVKIAGENGETETIKSEPLLVRKGGEVEYRETFRSGQIGVYTATANVEYAGTRSNTRDAFFEIVKVNLAALAGILAALTGLLGLIIFLIYRRFKEKNAFEIEEVRVYKNTQTENLDVQYVITNETGEDLRPTEIVVSLLDDQEKVKVKKSYLAEQLEFVPAASTATHVLQTDIAVQEGEAHKAVIAFSDNNTKFEFSSEIK